MLLLTLTTTTTTTVINNTIATPKTTANITISTICPPVLILMSLLLLSILLIHIQIELSWVAAAFLYYKVYNSCYLTDISEKVHSVPVFVRTSCSHRLLCFSANQLIASHCTTVSFQDVHNYTGNVFCISLLHVCNSCFIIIPWWFLHMPWALTLPRWLPSELNVSSQWSGSSVTDEPTQLEYLWN